MNWSRVAVVETVYSYKHIHGNVSQRSVSRRMDDATGGSRIANGALFVYVFFFVFLRFRRVLGMRIWFNYNIRFVCLFDYARFAGYCVEDDAGYCVEDDAGYCVEDDDAGYCVEDEDG